MKSVSLGQRDCTEDKSRTRNSLQFLHYDSTSLLHCTWNQVDPLTTDLSEHGSPFEVHGECELVSTCVNYHCESCANPQTIIFHPQRYYLNFSEAPEKLCFKYGGEAMFLDSCAIEYRDSGARFYRDHFLPLSEGHQNWIGKTQTGEIVILTIAHIYLRNGRIPTRASISTTKSSEALSESCMPMVRTQSQSHVTVSKASNHVLELKQDYQTSMYQPSQEVVPAWLVIVRREKEADIRGCIINAQTEWVDTPIEEANKQRLQKRHANDVRRSSEAAFSGKSATEQKIYKILSFVTENQVILSDIRLAEPTQALHDLIVKLDELELIEKHKFGVVLCKAGQSTENEVYNNQDSTPAFEHFLELLGRKVKLADYKGYLGGLDTKSQPDIQSYVTEFAGFDVMFLVSTMLPFQNNTEEQILRKRHIGNSSVTIVFQEEGAPPFEVDSIVSQFQQVLIIVHLIHDENGKPGYNKVAVCRSRDIPPFGPTYSADQVFEHNQDFAAFLLVKAINGANAAMKGEKLLKIVRRSRAAYLDQLVRDYASIPESDRKRARKFSHLRLFGQKLQSHSTTELPTIPVRSYRRLENADGSSAVCSWGPNEIIGGESGTQKLLDAGEDPWKDITSNIETQQFAEAFPVTLFDVHTVYGWQTASTIHRFSPSGDGLAAFPWNTSTDCQMVLSVSRYWVTFSSHGKGKTVMNRLMFAIKTSSIFAFSVGKDEGSLALYFDYGQFICLRTVNNHLNTIRRMLQTIDMALWPERLAKVNHLTVRVTEQFQMKPVSLNRRDLLGKVRTSHNQELRPYTLSDLGICITVADVPTRLIDMSPENPVGLPCIHQLERSNETEEEPTGLTKGQLLLRISTYSLVDLYRTVLRTPPGPSRAMWKNPFCMTNVHRPEKVHLTAELLNLMRRLQFTQEVITFVVCNATDIKPLVQQRDSSTPQPLFPDNLPVPRMVTSQISVKQYGEEISPTSYAEGIGPLENPQTIPGGFLNLGLDPWNVMPLESVTGSVTTPAFKEMTGPLCESIVVTRMGSMCVEDDLFNEQECQWFFSGAEVSPIANLGTDNLLEQSSSEKGPNRPGSSSGFAWSSMMESPIHDLETPFSDSNYRPKSRTVFNLSPTLCLPPITNLVPGESTSPSSATKYTGRRASYSGQEEQSNGRPNARVPDSWNFPQKHPTDSPAYTGEPYRDYRRQPPIPQRDHTVISQHNFTSTLFEDTGDTVDRLQDAAGTRTSAPVVQKPQERDRLTLLEDRIRSLELKLKAERQLRHKMREACVGLINQNKEIRYRGSENLESLGRSSESQSP
ncbi:signal-induced proliferation-associated 1-like protein 1 [Clonorchis sinensis]|uniref:Signal-induced proliferation-associated 1-like protein 1 n=1 Tax=Clonorchis sinensis TaxID=79923 RepID=G7YES1_CLOSI|nr:signal-induced proliferation-associated 1-like protein 1 [Clonorchis sinensis]